MKNEANLNSVKLTATPCDRVTYSVSHPETQNGTNPNEANLKPIFETENPLVFSAYLAKNKKMKSKPNFKIAKSHQISVFCTINRYFQAPHVSKGIKSKPNPNPIKPNLGYLFRGEPLLQFLPFISDCGTVPWNIIL